MKKLLYTLILFLVINVGVEAKIKIVSSSPDLASIANEIGGKLVEVSSLTNGKRNLHAVEILPSFILKVSKAEMYLKIGLGLDYWSDAVIDGSRNGSLIIVDCSKEVEILEIPSGKIDASMGDIHPEGNPHYWLDPKNGIQIAENIFASLVEYDPQNRTTYESNLNTFVSKLQQHIVKWKEDGRRISGLKVVSYHNSWPYLEKALDFNIIGFIEPKPGIEPTASHTAKLIETINTQQVKVIIREPYFSKRTPERIAKETGVNMATLPSMVGGIDGADDYFSLFDTIIALLMESDR